MTMPNADTKVRDPFPSLEPLEDRLLLAATVELVSRSSAGVLGDNFSRTPAVSADGRYVAFMSFAGNLVAGDTNNQPDIFVRDRTTGKTERVNVRSNGAQASGGGSYDPGLSADGRLVVFYSYTANLVAGDTNASCDVFVHDRQTGMTRRVSVSSAGGQAGGACQYPSLSADGRYVAFQSSAADLVAGDTNGTSDIFVHDRRTGRTKRVSVRSNGAQGNGHCYVPALSGNGRYVAFGSASDNLVAGDTNGQHDVFVHDRQKRKTTRVSVRSNGAQGNGFSQTPCLSADGRYVAYESYASNLVNGDTNGETDVFVYDRQTGRTQRVSVRSDGAQANRGAGAPTISADGRYVAYESYSSTLVPGDTNRRADVFVHDRQLHTTQRVSLTAQDRQVGRHSTGPALSADGQWIAFESDATVLVPGDTNDQGDIFVRSM